MDPCCQAVYVKFALEIETRQTEQHFPIFCCPIVLWIVGSVPALAHLLKGSEMVFCIPWLEQAVISVTPAFLSA